MANSYKSDINKSYIRNKKNYVQKLFQNYVAKPDEE